MESNRSILTRAIQKAIDGGWDFKKLEWSHHNVEIMAIEYAANPFEIIYNHDFAKALWGGDIKEYTVDYYTPNQTSKVHINRWQFYLQQMVIADDPIKYLSDNL